VKIDLKSSRSFTSPRTVKNMASQPDPVPEIKPIGMLAATL